MLEDLLLTCVFFPHKKTKQNSANGCRRRKVNWRMVWTKYSCAGVKVSKSLAFTLLYYLVCLVPPPTQCAIHLTILAIPLSKPLNQKTSVPFFSNSFLKCVTWNSCLGISEVYVEVPQDSFGIPTDWCSCAISMRITLKPKYSY